MKPTQLIAIWLVTNLWLVGCEPMINDFGFATPGQVEAAKNRLDGLLKRLPTVPGGILLDSIENPFTGTMAECTSLSLHQLYGTNELSFKEVLDFYSTSLQSTGWHQRLALDNARGFEIGDGIGLTVSDQYNASAVGRDAIREGQKRFRTLFLLEVGTSIIVPPPKRCREG